LIPLKQGAVAVPYQFISGCREIPLRLFLFLNEEGGFVWVPERLSSKNKTIIAAALLLFIAVVSYLDYLTPLRFTFSVFFIIPVAISTLFLGKRVGVLIALLSVTALLAAHVIQMDAYGNLAVHIWEAFSELVVLLTIAYILAMLRRANMHEAALARSDPLTGIANRRSFIELGQYEVFRSERFHQPLSIVYTDIDNFKDINDTYGHKAGDDLLRKVAAVVRENIRAVDTVARLGGDEFAIILPSAGYGETNEMVQRLQKELLSAIGDKGVSMGFSMGAVTCDSVCSIERMLQVADSLMYEVKRSGKNNYRHLLLRGDEKAPSIKKKEEEALRK
jgi:diguanylate cyclase (GGDEF)-like protein